MRRLAWEIWLKRSLIGLSVLIFIAAVSLWLLSVRWRSEFDREVALLDALQEPTHATQLAPAPIPDSENAALTIMKAALLLKSLDKEEEPDLDHYRDDKDADLAVLERWVAGRREYYDLMTEAVSQKRSRYPVEYAKGCQFDNPIIADITRCGRASVLRAILTSRKGSGSPSPDLQAVLRLSGSLSGEPLLVSQFVRYVLFELAADSLKMDGLKLASEEWRDLGSRFAAESFSEDYVRSMQMERATAIEVCRTQLFKGSFATAPDRPPESWWWVTPFAPRMGTHYLLSLTRAIEVSKLPYALAQPKELALSMELGRQRSWDQALGSLVISGLLRGHLVMAGTQSVQTVATEYCRIKAEGRAPESLDVVDPLTGMPLRYQRTPDGFRLWGVGRNLTDDDGTGDDFLLKTPE